MTTTPTKPLSRTALLERCRAGDQTAWATLVRSFERYVFVVCVRGYGLRSEEAEDIFQETFARTWPNLERIPHEEALRAWVGQVARRLCIDHVRALARTRLAADAAAGVAPLAERLDGIELALDVRDALDALPMGNREVLDRFFRQGQSYRQISDELGIAQGTVASRISRSLERLRGLLEHAAVGGELDPGDVASGV